MRISDWSSDVCSSDLDDLAPDRITRARYKLMTLLKERTGGQVALIAYSGDAFTVAPMTDDAAPAAALLDSFSPSVMPVAGQRAARALRRAAALISGAVPSGGQLLRTEWRRVGKECGRQGMSLR